ncbi:MAG: hypothetical protein ACLP7W_02575 [Solirubrobacteraceae bacterium]
MNTETNAGANTDTENAQTNPEASPDPIAATPTATTPGTPPALPTAEEMIARALPELRRKAREWSRDYPHLRLAAVLDESGAIVQTLRGVIAMFQPFRTMGDAFAAALASFVHNPPSTDHLAVCVLRPVWQWSFHVVDVRPHLRSA